MRFTKRLLCVCLILLLASWASAHEEHQHTAGDSEKLGIVNFWESYSSNSSNRQ